MGYHVPSPEERLEELESENRALRYALGLARAQIEELRNERDD